jgi:hypothetical protein
VEKENPLPSYLLFWGSFLSVSVSTRKEKKRVDLERKGERNCEGDEFYNQ